MSIEHPLYTLVEAQERDTKYSNLSKSVEAYAVSQKGVKLSWEDALADLY